MLLNGLCGKIKCTYSGDFKWWTEGAVYKVFKRPEGILIYDSIRNSRLYPSIEDLIEGMNEVGVNFVDVTLEDAHGKIVGYRCTNAGDEPEYWTVGKVYEVMFVDGQEYLLDDDGSNRCHYDEPLAEWLKDAEDYDEMTFEPVYAAEVGKTSNDTFVERVKQDIERLDKDREHLLEKRVRIQDQANQLDSKARLLEEVLETYVKYCKEEV